MREETPTSIAA